VENTLILKRGFASNIWENYENISNLLNTEGGKRMRDKNQSRDWIESYVEVPKQRRTKQMNLIANL
jgi:hypothetical protein